LVPRDRLITVKDATGKSTMCKKAEELKVFDKLSNPKHSAFAIFILEERKKDPKDQFFMPFFNVLPQETVDYP
jgi:hypothetical protein